MKCVPLQINNVTEAIPQQGGNMLQVPLGKGRR